MPRNRSDSGHATDLSSLVRAAMGGDRSAFDLLVDHYRERVYRCCYRVLGHAQDAEDATADTFLRAWLKRDTYRPEAGSSFEAWLLTVARNLCHRL